MLNPLYIGPYKLASNLLLAPMAGITDRPYRDICRSFGAGLTTAEMISSDVSLWDSKKSSTRLISKDETEPRCAQIVGTDPETMANAAKRCADQGIQIIDINLGCPAKKVCNKAAGSALLQYPDQVEAILTKVVSAVDIPVTVKIRTGWSNKNKNALQIAHIAEQSGISALSIHGRTREEGFTGNSEYETIRLVKQQTSIPVFANGDISTIHDAAYILNYTGADGLLLGRVTRGKPWVFAEINHYLKTKKIPSPLSTNEQIKAALAHIYTIHRYYNSVLRVRMANKHIGCYLNTMSTQQSVSKDILIKIFTAKNSSQQLEQFSNALEELTNSPKTRDSITKVVKL
ncbi:MAG TPA: tRNA dihydrouridine synthase DusB [Leucothrix mucor]|uniref:tRNA-dihydrouridine synthase n=1 Tax=Leucothrix mucor TaxID=45248 RepID=A0A7V2WVQ8_LEUMU|nr:tRNA dihydrouridine synthase DusB [Leucothrix mucor]